VSDDCVELGKAKIGAVKAVGLIDFCDALIAGVGKGDVDAL